LVRARRTAHGARFNYNEAIARSLNEQLPLNLVRLRDRDTPLFIGAIHQSRGREGAGSGRLSVSAMLDSDGWTAGGA
jgi:hypothetical protein